MLRRRGVTLLEMLVALVLASALASLVLTVLLNTLAVAGTQLTRMELLRTLRYGTTLLVDELRGLAPSRGDLLALTPTSVRYRATRGLAVICAAGADWIVVRRRFHYAVRSWVPGRDSLLVHLAHDSAAGLPARWEVVPLVTAPVGAACPDLSWGTRLGVTFPVHVSPGYVVPGHPLRVFEPMEMRLYPSSGHSWLGQRSLTGGGAIQPVLGPMTGNGLRLVAVDGAGWPTALLHRVAALRIHLAARSTNPVRPHWPAPLRWLEDSLAVSVAFREP